MIVNPNYLNKDGYFTQKVLLSYPILTERNIVIKIYLVE